MKPPGERRHGSAPGPAFTLLEILMVLAIAAVLLAVTVPYFGDIFDPGDESAEAVRTLAREVRAEAVDSGEARWLQITSTGVTRVGGNNTATQLPEGWSIQVKRYGENRFRKPAKREIWEFNGEGICEPLSLLIATPDREILLEFDPLTALEPPQI